MRLVSGIYKNRILKTLKGDHTRPTASAIRDAIMNICAPYLQGAKVLDLFAGSGAIGLEALSRGADSVVFVDNNRSACQVIQANIASLGVGQQSVVLREDVFSALARLEKQGQEFDIIYVDPPYGERGPHYADPYSLAVLMDLDRRSLLKGDGRLVIEEGMHVKWPGLSLTQFMCTHDRSFGSTRLRIFTRLAESTPEEVSSFDE